LASPLNKNIFVVRLGRKIHDDMTAFAKPLTLCVMQDFDYNGSSVIITYK